jgi:2-keto-3-deoxy-L-rhamnonate aldolase RhmA
MRTNAVKQALRQGQVQLGTSFGQLRDPEVARVLAAAGFHWAFIDTEHGFFDVSMVHDICRIAVLAGLSPIVRVTDLQYALVARALDIGAQGIIFPRVESPELLATAVSWTKFPPVGVRGFGLNPMHMEYDFASIPAVLEHVNAETMVVLQLETQRAVEAREEILSVPGIDAVMIGPVDLSISLGVPGDFQHPRMIDAMEKIRDTCIAKGIAPGTQTRNVQLAKFWRDRGMRFLGTSSEWAMMFEKGKELVAALQ